MAEEDLPMNVPKCPNMFAGSILDLEPDTEYECRFLMSDPDGVHDYAQKEVTVRTRAEPKPFEGGEVFHLYPPDYGGPKEKPAFPSLMSAYRRANPDPNLPTQAGNTILVHAGLYMVDTYNLLLYFRLQWISS
jgi:hypothetical protein